MNVNGIFKTLLTVCVFVFLVSFLAGVISLIVVLLLWALTLYFIGREQRHKMENLKDKYSAFYIKPNDYLIPEDQDADEQTKLIVENAVSSRLSLPSKIDEYTLWIDVLVTTESLIFVYLFDDSVYSVDSIDWNIVKQNLQNNIESKSEEEKYSALVETKRSWICRYIIKSSQNIKDIVITCDELKKLISK